MSSDTDKVWTVSTATFGLKRQLPAKNVRCAKFVSGAQTVPGELPQSPATFRGRGTNLGTLFIPAGGVTSLPNIPANQSSPVVPIA